MLCTGTTSMILHYDLKHASFKCIHFQPSSSSFSSIIIKTHRYDRPLWSSDGFLFCSLFAMFALSERAHALCSQASSLHLEVPMLLLLLLLLVSFRTVVVYLFRKTRVHRVLGARLNTAHVRNLASDQLSRETTPPPPPPTPPTMRSKDVCVCNSACDLRLNRELRAQINSTRVLRAQAQS